MARVARFYSGINARELPYGELCIMDSLRGVTRKEEAWLEHELTPEGIEDAVLEATGDKEYAALERAKAESLEQSLRDRWL